MYKRFAQRAVPLATIVTRKNGTEQTLQTIRCKEATFKSLEFYAPPR